MTGLERLKRLIVVLEEVAKDPAKAREFDMETWASEEPNCGTHHCACGWGAVDPVLRAEGLKLERRTLLDQPRRDFSLAYREFRDFAAAGEFFDINRGDVEYLFDPDEYKDQDALDEEGEDEDYDPTSIQPVIDRIKEFVASKESQQ